MVVRYGAINDSVGEVTPEDTYTHFDRTESRQSDDSRSIWDKYRHFLTGTLLSLISGILFTANNFIINQLHVVVIDCVLVRCIIQIIICGIIIYWNDDSLLPQNHKKKLFIFLQGFTGAISFITCLASVSFMPVPDALCIIFACPVVTIILSAFILGDKLNSLKCFAGTLLFLGVVLVCQPPFLFPKNTFFLSPSTFLFSAHSGLFYVGVILASTGCVTGGLMDVLIAKCQGVSTAVLVCWSAICGLVITILSSLIMSNSRILSSNIVSISLSDWIILILLAISGLFAFSTLTHALKLISPNLVASLRSLELVLAYSVQVLWLGESPDTWSCLGGGLIFVGVLVLAAQDKIKQIFQYRRRHYVPYHHTAEEYSRLYG